MTENKRGGKEDDGDKRKKQDLNTAQRIKKEKPRKGKRRLITEKHGTIRFPKFYKTDLLIHYKSNGSTNTPPHIRKKKKPCTTNRHIAYTETDGRSDFNRSPKSYFLQLLW